MERMYEFVEKALISAMIAGMLGLGVIGFFMGAVGATFTSVNSMVLLLGYLALCLAIWLILMFPYIKKV